MYKSDKFDKMYLINALINHTPFRWHMVDPSYSRGTRVLYKNSDNETDTIINYRVDNW